MSPPPLCVFITDDEPRPVWTVCVLRETTSRGLCGLVCQGPCVCLLLQYYKAVREGGGGKVEDMCYERLRAEAYVN